MNNDIFKGEKVSLQDAANGKMVFKIGDRLRMTLPKDDGFKEVKSDLSELMGAASANGLSDLLQKSNQQHLKRRLEKLQTDMMEWLANGAPDPAPASLQPFIAAGENSTGDLGDLVKAVSESLLQDTHQNLAHLADMPAPVAPSPVVPK